MSHHETTELIDQAKRGEMEAFNALFTRCAPRLLPYVRRRVTGSLRRQLESADILQEVFTRSFQSFPTFTGKTAGQLLGWMMKIAQNNVNDVARYYQRDMRDIRLAAPLDEAAHEQVRMASALSATILGEKAAHARARLEAALDRLPPLDAEIFVLHRLEELSFVEIGARLDMGEDACRYRFRCALAAVAPLLAPPGSDQ